MIMGIKAGTIGVPLRVATGFNMSGSTSLTLVLTKPSGAKLTKTNPDVTAPAVALVDAPGIGSVAASTYFEYTNTIDDYDETGTWAVCGTYQDATQTLPVSPVQFTIDAGCS
jgi:hypothetical protein